MQGWRGKRVHFAHVPRERNSWAHHLAAQALVWGREVELQELPSSPPLGESALHVILPLLQVEPASAGGNGVLCAAVWAEGESDTTELCQRCKLPIRENMAPTHVAFVEPHGTMCASPAPLMRGLTPDRGTARTASGSCRPRGFGTSPWTGPCSATWPQEMHQHMKMEPRTW